MSPISFPSTQRPQVIKRRMLAVALSVITALALLVLSDTVPVNILLLFLDLFVGVVIAAAVVWYLFFMRRETSNHGFETLYENHPDPSFLTGLDGQIMARNRVAKRLFAQDGNVAQVLQQLTEDADQVVYRLAQLAKTSGIATTHISSKGQVRHLTAQTVEGKCLLWHIADGRVPGVSDFNAEWMEDFPLVELDPNGTVLRANAAAHQVFGTEFGRLEDILSDLPLRHGGLHASTLDPEKPYRAYIKALDNGYENVLFTPCDADEVSNLLTDELLEDLPVGLARISPDGQLIVANEIARGLLGPQAVPGRQFAGLIEGLGRSLPERISDTMKGRSLGRAEIARGRINDREIFLQVSLTRVVFNGEPSLLAAISDATELKTLEAQFVQSQKMQAVGQLAGGVAHDFNNLLTAISGHCDLLLLRHDRGDPSHGDLKQIHQNATRAAGLVRQLLAFSRKQTLRPITLHLPDVLDDLAHLLNRLLGAKVSLDIQADEGLWPVRVDERQFEQVIVNLVVNSRDAMSDGGDVILSAENLVLEDELKRDQAKIIPGQYVKIEVRDNGVGIPPDKIGKVFEPFFTTKRIGEGTGLGLSTVYGIVKQTGGYIFCDSTPNVGTTFSIYLPIAEEVSQSGASKADNGAVEGIKARDLTGRGVILLVEDEVPVRAFAARALQLRGYTVLEAEDGNQALKILEDDDLNVDLFLSDVIMPGLDGPGWITQALQTRPQTPVIFMSGYAEGAFDQSGPELKDASFLAKPFSLTDLAEQVKDKLVDPDPAAIHSGKDPFPATVS